MTAASGVPSALRPVLEKALMVSHMMARTAEYTPDLMRDAWESLHMAVRAALASDAGTPEGAGTPYSIAMAEGTAVEQADERQLLEALGKAAAPDAELERLLIEYARCQVLARERNAVAPQSEVSRRAYEVEWAAAAIRAHVERVKREARDVESGWLIERAHPGGPVWAAIPDPQMARRLITRLQAAIVPTTDANEALRFSREVDAEAFRLANLSEWANARSTEHVFLPPTATPEAPDAHP